MPEEWKCGIVTPIYKNGEKKIAKSYKGITLMDAAYKIYAEILRNRLEDEMEKKKMLEDTQTGYRKETGTIDAIYMIKTAVEEEIKREKGEAYILFADMVGAFDKIRRKSIWRIMMEEGIDKQLRERIEELHEEAAFKIKINNKLSENFYMKEGVRQGCPLSTALFNLTFAGLEKEMRKAQEGGIVVGKRKIWSVSYADDVALLAGNETGFKEMLKRFGKYIEKIGLKLNTEKTKVMICKKAEGRRKNLSLSGKVNK